MRLSFVQTAPKMNAQTDTTCYFDVFVKHQENMSLHYIPT